MALQKLSDPMAFAMGAELWVLPGGEHSHWSRKIDWYLNFQALRASTHQAPALDPGLIRLLQEESLAQPTTQANPGAPLMISTAHRLPARATVQLPFNGKLKPWLKQIADIWHQMGHPATRIFLPTGESFNDCMTAWSEPGSQNVSVVPDSDHQTTTGS
ncbi:MAG: hypothetical protein AB7N80_10605 [Bdellovibrionales bacterium]